MNYFSTVIATMAFSVGILSNTQAADVKKNAPSKSTVEKTLQEIGGDHFPEKMKISELGSIETDSTYYHIFVGTLKGGGFHYIFFDNTPTYLGYYLITYEPYDYGEGEFYLSRTSDSRITVPISDKGPTDKLTLEGTGESVTFVKAPVKEVPVVEAPVAVKSTFGGPQKAKKPTEYRPWTVTMGGNVIEVESAIFVEMKDGQVTLQSAKNGQLATVPVKALSAADRAYLRDILE